MRGSIPRLVRDQAFRYHQDGDLVAAEHLYELLLQAGRKDPELLYMFGVLRYQQDRRPEALAYLKRSSRISAKNPAWALRGVIEADLGRLPEALAAYDRALALKSDHWEVYTNRAVVLTGLGRHEEALESCDRALALRPNLAAAHNNRGNALRDLHRWPEARAAYDAAIALDPQLATAHNNRGKLAIELGYPIQGLGDYARALALDPGYVEARRNLRVVLAAMDDPLTALANLPELPLQDAFDLFVEAADRLERRDRLDEALVGFDKALALKPADVALINRKAITLAQFGRLGQAAEVLSHAIALAPSEPSFYYNYGLFRSFEVGHSFIKGLVDLEHQSEKLTQKKQTLLQFALAKAASDIGDHSRSVMHLSAGNALERSQFSYDPATVDALLDSIKSMFSHENLSTKMVPNETTYLPIFIVGMPRAGSTLVHHIMSGHSKVFGAGETGALESVMDSFSASKSKPYPSMLDDLSTSDLRRIAEEYLGRVSPPSAEIKAVLDKSIVNFWYLGLLHLALPQARFVHVVRDPVDTCFSCFSQLFNTPMLFAYDLRELGRYYRAYAAMMQHWDRVLPSGTMLEIRYEDIVANPEQQARRLVAYCDLEWEPGCLDTHLNSRPVRTSSIAQVRQPIYSTSVGRSRQHEIFLQPLLDALLP